MTSIASTLGWSRALALGPPRHLGELFTQDPDRRDSLVVAVDELIVDFSRQRIDANILEALVAAAGECGVDELLGRMWSGDPINSSEGRAVGHVALRMGHAEHFIVDGADVVPVVRKTLASAMAFAEGVRSGSVVGATGRAFTTVLNIGIGGSDLGPRLVDGALRHLHHERISCRFVANVDPSDLREQLKGLDPSETLVIISSKTFTTIETLMNARAAVDWIRAALGSDAVRHHVVAVSADPRAVAASGLEPGTMFPFWEWIGGRFSIGSAVGLGAMISVGPASFTEMLSGMRAVDEHVRHSTSNRNAALLMALIGVWNHAALGHPTRAVIPYSSDLRGLPAYLQQLTMESNGKSVHSDGSAVDLPTAPVLWGDTGTNAQHAFMQLIHQGPSVVPVDFIGFAQAPDRADGNARERQRVLFTNMAAQAQALAFGRPTMPGEPHRAFDGNRPSTVIVARRLSPRSLGALVALYEHAVFYEGVLLGVNSFDQWGVELGKDMAAELMRSGMSPEGDVTGPVAAGRQLLEWFEANSRDEQG